MTRSQWLAEDGPRSGRCNWIKRLAGALFILVILWHMCSLAMYAESDEAVPTADEYAYTRESDLARLSDSDRRLNLKYCGRELCKWFFVYRHPEQESRAQTWFRVFSSAAQMLNRTVVLPHVGKSRIRSCAGHSFDFYYDVDALRERYPNITFVHQDQFVEWTRLRERVPTTRMLSIKLSNNITDDMTWSYTNMDNDFVKNRTCLNGARLAVESTPVNTTFLEMRLNWWLESGITPKLRNRIVSNLMATNPDVLLVESQNIHTTLFTGADTPPIPYAKPIFNTTNRLVDTYLRPFVAIHWRMELAPSENLRTCAQELVKFLPQFMDSRGIKNVYLATDYPIMGGNHAQSDTFDTLDDAHHEAFRIVNSSSLKPQTWVSLRDGDERFNSLEGLTELGGGLQGIVDKLVCTHADYFLTPPPGCRKPTSTWTSAVIEERKKLKENDHNIKNEVEEWSTMYDFVQRENVQTQNMRRKNEHRKNGHRKNGHRKNVHTKNV